MSQENVEVVQRFMRRWADQDADGALEDVDAAAVLDWSNSEAPDSGVYTGRPAWRAFMQRRDEAFGNRRIETTEVLTPAPDTVVLCVRIREEGLASGVEVESAGGSVWTLQAGKVVHLKLYQSAAEALRAVGLDG